MGEERTSQIVKGDKVGRGELERKYAREKNTLSVLCFSIGVQLHHCSLCKCATSLFFPIRRIGCIGVWVVEFVFKL